MMHVLKPVVFNDLDFQRDSEGYYYESDGELTVAGIDVPRYGYDPETLDPIGLIIEGACTNLVTRSNDFLHADWIKSGSPTITAAATTSPDGTSNAFSWDYISGAQYIKQAVAASTMRCSIYAKVKTSVDGECKVRLRLAGTSSVFELNYASPSYTGDKGKIQKLQNNWLRISLKEIFTSGTVDFQIEAVKGSFYFCFAMVEHSTTENLNNTPTSYVVSGASQGTRAADSIDAVSEPPSIIDSNIDEDDYPAYNPATAYDFEDRVIITTGVHRIYKSIVAGTETNTGNYPPSSPTQWLDEGATNRWRLFRYDVGVANQTVNQDSIFYRFITATKNNAIAFFNVEAASINIKMYFNESLVYERDINLIGNLSEASWYELYFGDRRVKNKAVLLDLPPVYPATFDVTITSYATGYDAKIGKLVVGYANDLGVSQYGASSGIVDYSIKTEDDFGNYYFVERTFVDTASMQVVVERGSEDFAKRTLSAVRAIPAVYIGSSDIESFMIFGKTNDFDLLFSTPAFSYLSLTLEGI